MHSLTRTETNAVFLSVCWQLFLIELVLWVCCFRVWTMTTLKISCFWKRRGGWVSWWVEQEVSEACVVYVCFLISSFPCLFCVTPLSSLLGPSGFPLSWDQSLGDLRYDWHSDWTHRLFYRCGGGRAGWRQIQSDQREYPFNVFIFYWLRTGSEGSSLFRFAFFSYLIFLNGWVGWLQCWNNWTSPWLCFFSDIVQFTEAGGLSISLILWTVLNCVFVMVGAIMVACVEVKHNRILQYFNFHDLHIFVSLFVIQSKEDGLKWKPHKLSILFVLRMLTFKTKCFSIFTFLVSV